MELDPKALKELDDAVQVFDEAYVTLVQAVRRVQRIYELPSTLRTYVEPPVPKPPAPSGKFCPKCNGIRLREKGGGCLACLECGFDLGCNG